MKHLVLSIMLNSDRILLILIRDSCNNLSSEVFIYTRDITHLSDGEKTRLLLAEILSKPSNTIVL